MFLQTLIFDVFFSTGGKMASECVYLCQMGPLQKTELPKTRRFGGVVGSQKEPLWAPFRACPGGPNRPRMRTCLSNGASRGFRRRRNAREADLGTLRFRFFLFLFFETLFSKWGVGSKSDNVMLRVAWIPFWAPEPRSEDPSLGVALEGAAGGRCRRARHHAARLCPLTPSVGLSFAARPSSVGRR